MSVSSSSRFAVTAGLTAWLFSLDTLGSWSPLVAAVSATTGVLVGASGLITWKVGRWTLTARSRCYRPQQRPRGSSASGPSARAQKKS